ncbi:preprotein translocase subunit YajC [Streptomyces qinzhouensis]|uniref:Preprotein translocase subunit YajC n=1 Tax=Streptomyces qinzhouensis TaxID=2599401 RepID=A0A5B8J630_9ACTN|nr:preprotein translocase subunit YajC [Streptomyces qinzhouensis]QDY75884.1 preprotein translocase subunit YajC [Streptomyces qinzhouensis]
MSLLTFLPFIVLIGAMFLMTRSAKKKQQQAAAMRDSMQPGTGVRTIGGMYATVKELHDETVLLEIAPGIYAVYAKNAIGAVLSDEEYNHIVHGDDPDAAPVDEELPAVPDDASSLTEAGEPAGDAKIDLGKKPEAGKDEVKDADADTAAEAADATASEEAAPSTDGKADGKK